MRLVMQVLPQLLVHSTVLAHHYHWSSLIVVSVLLALRLMIQVLARCLMGDSLHRICGYRVV
jgi:hypothetical protein